MNFYERVKHDLTDEQKRRGLGSQVLVDSRALLALLDDYEALDSLVRLEKGYRENLGYQLHNAIRAMYESEKKNGERTLLIIMETLTPLIEENNKRTEYHYRFDRNNV